MGIFIARKGDSTFAGLMRATDSRGLDAPANNMIPERCHSEYFLRNFPIRLKIPN